MRRGLGWIVVFLVLIVAAAYLHDPPWAGRITSGLRDWEVDDDGVRFRWTSGHASFFIPSSESTLGLRLRGAFPGRGGAPVVVRLAVDDRPLTAIALTDPEAWQAAMIPLPRRSSGRRYRRVDLWVDRTVGQYNLGVQLGELYFPAFALRRSAQIRFIRSE